MRQGDLAPYAELAWFTTPTEAEVTWMGEAPLRLAELGALLDAGLAPDVAALRGAHPYEEPAFHVVENAAS